MPQKKPMSDVELAAFETSQNFEALLAQSARELVAGKTRKVHTPGRGAPAPCSAASQSCLSSSMTSLAAAASSGPITE